MDRDTIEYYNSRASSITCWYEQIDASSLHDSMLKWLPKAGKILDIGCGSGRDAAFLASLGPYEVTASDASPNMVSEAKQLHSQVSFIEASFPLPEDHPLFSSAFHGITAVAVIMHIPDSQFSGFFKQIYRLLLPGGIFFCSYSIQRDEERKDNRLFAKRDPADVQKLLEGQGFTLLHQQMTSDAAGRNISWITQVFNR